MSFIRYDDNGVQIRNRVVLDCSNDPVLTEQSHKAEVDINNIVARHGVDMIQATAKAQELVFDDIPNNDFMEAMLLVKRGQEEFMKLPSNIRQGFNNDPALFLDFVQNKDNTEAMIELGLAKAPPAVAPPMQVEVVNPPQE